MVKRSMAGLVIMKQIISVTDTHTDGRTDRQTDRLNTNICSLQFVGMVQQTLRSF